MKRERIETLLGLLPESQGHNLALSVLHVPFSHDSGTLVRIRIQESMNQVNMRDDGALHVEDIPRQARKVETGIQDPMARGRSTYSLSTSSSSLLSSLELSDTTIYEP